MNTPCAPGRWRRLRLGRLMSAVLGVWIWGWLAAGADAAAQKDFAIERGEAVATLKQFAAQAEQQLLYAGEAVRRVKTNAVRGRFSAVEALARMLAGTSLIAEQDPRTGAFTVSARQSAPPLLKPEMLRETTIQLSPFTVFADKDSGYIATNVISGGMLATNLQKTATDVTVLTRDFLNDIGAASLQDAQIWLTNADVGTSPTTGGTNPTDFGGNVAFRGLPSTTNGRNYFRQGFTPEEYVVERLEGSRGPNGIIYGDATVGGKVNVVTKRATLTRDFTTLRVRLDSFGEPFGRAVYLDANRRLTERWAVRLNVQDKVGAQWYERSLDNRHGVDLTTTYRPWSGAEIRFEAAKDFVGTSNFRADGLIDNSSRWDRAYAVTTPLTVTPANTTGVIRISAANYYTYQAGLGLVNWKNMGLSQGSKLTLLTDATSYGRELIPNMPVLPRRRFNPNSNDMVVENHATNFNLTYEQKFPNGLFIEVAGDFNSAIREGNTLYYTGAYVDVNRQTGDGRMNPNFGKFFSANTAGANPIRTADYFGSARLAAAYPFKTETMSQTFSVVAQWREHLAAYKSWQYYVDNGALAPNGSTLDSGQLLKRFRYWDEPAGADVLPPSDATAQYRWVFARDQHNVERLYSIQANTVGHYWQDRVLLVAGIRRDHFHATTRDIARRDPVTGAPTLLSGIWTDSRVTTSQMGLTYFPLKQIGLYGYRSHGFNPAIINIPKLDGSAPYNLATSQGWGAGVRFNLLDNRLVGTFGFYDAFEKDKFTNQNLNNINNVWNAVLNAGGPNKVIPQIGAFIQYTDVSDLRSWGWEGEITANLTKGLRMTVNLGLPETKQTGYLRDTKGYYQEHFAEWMRYRGNSSVHNAMTNLENIISGTTDGRPLNGLYDYRINAFANYTMQTGRLKGLRIGGGVNCFGRQIVGSPTNDPFSFFYTDPYVLATAALGYSWKQLGCPMDLQLNVTNLFDYDRPIFKPGGVSVFNGTSFRNTFYWTPPRQWRLTLTMAF
ncbi:MAG: hypothetical protein HZA31_02250 [Opitutae bacterium]|nr:hypothetical protein [Opitutae bacterium]